MNYMNDITSIFTLQVSITWQWIEGYQNMTVDSTLWSSGQPQGVDKCAEWNTVLQGLKVVPCSAKRGYVCEKNMF